MKKALSFIIGIILVGILLLATGVIYTIDEKQQAIVTQFGQLIGKAQRDAGLYFKYPWQKVNYFEKRILQWDGDADQIPTRDKRLIWVDTTARWRIVDALKYMKRVRNEPSAQTRLDDIIDAKTREVISSYVLIESIRNSNRLIEEGEKEDVVEVLGKATFKTIRIGREKISRIILAKSQEALSDYGIEILDVRIKHINYVKEVRRKVYERMISERKRAAEQFRAEGQGKKAEIEGQKSKELQGIQSEAYRKAQEILGVADAKAIKIYADAYNKDPEFYTFLKTLETYKKTINKDTTLLLTTENEFYSQLNGINFSK